MITVTMLTKNSERLISPALESVRWADEIIVLDTGSEDHTLEIAKTFPNVTIHKSSFLGFGPLHNYATSLASHDWILSIDSDELVTLELAEEITSLTLDPACVYSIPRHNYFNGKWIKGCGWYPDRCLRLYHRKTTCFTDHHVHESLQTQDVQIVELQGALHHFSYTSIADFLEKMQLYSTLYAMEHRHKKKGSLLRALLHASFAFGNSYLLQRGLFLGYEGFVISLYKGHTAYYKYLKLKEINSEVSPLPDKDLHNRPPVIGSFPEDQPPGS